MWPETLLPSWVSVPENWLWGSMGMLEKVLQRSVTERNVLAGGMAKGRGEGEARLGVQV